jgi:predicted nucleic acid-binding protein
LAVCPLTELGFLRISTQAFGAGVDEARRVLRAWLEARQPRFVSCDIRALEGVKPPGGGQTTDYYLANLAKAHGLELATLDEHIAHPAAFVIPKLSVPSE